MRQIGLLLLVFLIFVVIALIYKIVVVTVVNEEDTGSAQDAVIGNTFQGPPVDSVPRVKGPVGPPPR